MNVSILIFKYSDFCSLTVCYLVLYLNVSLLVENCVLNFQSFPIDEATLTEMGVLMSGSPILIPRYTRYRVSEGPNAQLAETDRHTQQLCSVVLQISDYDQFQR
jgi:hypothetical protein